jgi:hypothetical protein
MAQPPPHKNEPAANRAEGRPGRSDSVEIANGLPSNRPRRKLQARAAKRPSYVVDKDIALQDLIRTLDGMRDKPEPKDKTAAERQRRRRAKLKVLKAVKAAKAAGHG